MGKIFDSLKDNCAIDYSYISKMFANKIHDCYIYYSADENGEYRLPRICFFGNFSGGSVTIYDNVYGMYNGRYVEEEYDPVLRDILNENFTFMFGKQEFDGRFISRSGVYTDVETIMSTCSTFRAFSDIEKKVEAGVPLTREEIKVLYARNEYLLHGDDNIRERIQSKRDVVADLCLACGDDSCLDFSLTLADSVKSFSNFIFPRESKKDIYMMHIKELKNVLFPELMERSVFFEKLVSAEEVYFPRVLSCPLRIPFLTIADKVIFPEVVHGDVSLSGLIEKEVDGKRAICSGELHFNNCVLPKKIYGALVLGKIADFKNLELPVYVQGPIYYDGKLITLEQLKLIQARERVAAGWSSNRGNFSR